jgi:hypothetical protein
MNIFNQDFINDSYQFLKSLQFFEKVRENEFVVFENIFTKYAKEQIFFSIKNLYEKSNKIKKNGGEAKISLFGASLSIWKEENNSLFKDGMINLKDLKFDQILKNTSPSPLPQAKEATLLSANKYDSLFDKLIHKKQEEDKQAEELKKRTENAKSAYEREELNEYFRMCKEDPRIKKQINLEKGNFFSQLSQFEEDLSKYFLVESQRKDQFIPIKNKDFEMSFKIETGNTVTVRFSKELEMNIIPLLSLLYETAFYPKWFPFCSHSDMLVQPGKAKKLVYMVSSLPVISDRDFLIYGFGVNRLKENNSILMLVRSIDETSNIFQEQFKKKESKKYVRAFIKIFGFEMQILSPTKIKVTGLMNSDPKISFIPQGLVNTIAKQVMKIILFKK